MDVARARVIAVAGATAVGKSAFAVRLALALGGEVVSADSVQVYRGLDVGSAKPTLAERQGVPHHLLDVCDPRHEAMDARRFSVLAAEAIADIAARGRVAVVAGGTGLYLKAALGEWSFPGPGPDALLRQRLARLPTAALWEELRARDPVRAARLSPRDRPRLVRALEGGGGGCARPSPYRLRKILLWRPRAELYRRIDARAERQWRGGLLEEAKALLALPPEHPAARALGYREGRWYWRGLVTDAEGLRLYARNTRRFAKRQETWFRKEEGYERVRAGGPEEDSLCASLCRWAEEGW